MDTFMMLQQESHHDTRVGLALEIITLPLEYLTENFTFPLIKSQMMFGTKQVQKLNDIALNYIRLII